jgi:AcrR family transcriptional regulator
MISWRDAHVRSSPELLAGAMVERQSWNLSEKMFKIIFWRYDCHLVEDKAMSYSPQHKHDTREKILESARRLFNRNGYSGVSIDEIMTEVGLTHGGFYRHFSGKDELYAAAVRQFLCTKTPAGWQSRRAAVTKSHAQRIVDAYFSREHFDDHDGCCPLLGTAADVERHGEIVKASVAWCSRGTSAIRT